MSRTPRGACVGCGGPKGGGYGRLLCDGCKAAGVKAPRRYASDTPKGPHAGSRAALVLAHVGERGTASVAEVAEALGLTRAEATVSLRGLAEANRLVVVGQGRVGNRRWNIYAAVAERAGVGRFLPLFGDRTEGEVDAGGECRTCGLMTPDPLAVCELCRMELRGERVHGRSYGSAA